MEKGGLGAGRTEWLSSKFQRQAQWWSIGDGSQNCGHVNWGVQRLGMSAARKEPVYPATGRETKK
jgi:hypothetical protein